MSALRTVALVALCACGDNVLPDAVPLVPGGDLVIVAHQDDDLLFMQPDVLEAVQRGGGVTILYITAGNATGGANNAERRYAGLREAYGEVAGSHDWHCGWLALDGHVAQHCRLADKPMSLVFLGYPDGAIEGDHATSLLHLWEGAVDRVDTIAERPTSYNRDELIDTVAEVVRETQPRRVRTLEVAATHGRDHSDHMLAGALALLAIGRANNHADLLAYRGYSVEFEPANKLPALVDATRAPLSRYDACATGCAPCGDACTTTDPHHVTWLERRYAIGFRPAAAGRLRSGSRCLTYEFALADCTDAPSWHLDRGGELRTDDNRCLFTQPTGDVAVADCLGGPERRVFIDDEGHIWSAVPPDPVPAMDYAHLRCLAPTANGVRMELCGRDAAPAWELAPRTTATARADLGLAATGREVRLGDIDGDGFADLCAIESGLVCARGDGTGAFMPATRIDSVVLPLAIDPRSLALGDVDGDRRVDACGRDADGVLCATAASGFAAERWSAAFDDQRASAGTSASLTAVDANADGTAEICGVDITGVVCAPHGLTFAPIARSAWPSPTSVVWPADLDGDRQADWCSATDGGPACAIEAERPLTTDGAPWGYAFGGSVDVAPATTVTAALADIDGDGRADLCSTREDRVLCARSQGHAFGPRTTTLAILPNQSVASALWLGDLNGDGRADACVDTGTQIACAVEPNAR